MQVRQDRCVHIQSLFDQDFDKGAKAVAAYGQQLLWLAADFRSQEMEIVKLLADRMWYEVLYIQEQHLLCLLLETTWEQL